MERLKATHLVSDLRSLASSNVDARWVYRENVPKPFETFHCSVYHDVEASSYESGFDPREQQVVFGMTKQGQVICDTELVFNQTIIPNATRIEGHLRRIETPLFHLSYHWSSNYQHWLFDDLPRLWMFRRLLEFVPDLKLLIDGKLFSSWIQRGLQLLGVTDDQLVIRDSSEQLVIDRLFVSSFLSVNPGCYSHPEWMTDESWEIFDELRDVAVKVSDVEPFVNAYVSRRDTKNWWHKRSLVNEDELVAVAEEFGFRELIGANYDLADEIAMFAGASRLIGPSGATLANLLWLDGGSVVVLDHPRWGAHFYKYLSYRRGAKCVGVSGGYMCDGVSDAVNEPWVFPADIFRTQLENLLTC